MLCGQEVPAGQDCNGLKEYADCTVCYNCGKSHQDEWRPRKDSHGVIVPIQMIPPHLRGRSDTVFIPA